MRIQRRGKIRVGPQFGFILYCIAGRLARTGVTAQSLPQDLKAMMHCDSWCELRLVTISGEPGAIMRALELHVPIQQPTG